MSQDITILVVDDEPALVDGLAVFLVDEGYSVRVARDGEEALMLQRAAPCDLIVSDVMMPRMDGWQLVAELREQGDATPVVLMSAGGRRPGDTPGISTMAKPFDLAALLSVIESLIRCR